MGEEKPVTKAYLKRAAVHYLERYSSSVHNLKQVLGRKIRRRQPSLGALSGEHQGWVEEVADWCLSLGYVSDQRYAEMRVLSMHRAGKAVRAIQNSLRQKGVGPAIIEQAFNSLKEELSPRDEASHFDEKTIGAKRGGRDQIGSDFGNFSDDCGEALGEEFYGNDPHDLGGGPVEKVQITHDDLDLMAAVKYARRRRFGPYRRDVALNDEIEPELTFGGNAMGEFDGAEHALEVEEDILRSEKGYGPKEKWPKKKWPKKKDPRKNGPKKFAQGAGRQERYRKELGAFARAGFSFDLARRVVEAESVESLEEMLRFD